MWESDLRLDGGAENVFGLAQRPQQQQQQHIICRPGSNPVGPRCATAGRMMPWERPRPRPEGQFNNCDTLREGIGAPSPRLNISQVQCTAIWTTLFGVLIDSTARIGTLPECRRGSTRNDVCLGTRSRQEDFGHVCACAALKVVKGLDCCCRVST